MDARFRPYEWVGVRTPPGKKRLNPFPNSPYSKTLDLLEYELEKIRASEILIEAAFTDAQIRLDGWPKAGQRPSYSGLKISFNLPDVGRVEYACDSCRYFEDNIRSIALTLQALRSVARYGAVSGMQQYTGFRALEAGNGDAKRGAATWIAKMLSQMAETQKTFRDVLLEPDGESRRKLINTAKKKAHPDTGGSTEMYQLLEEKLQILGV
jgi:hypothetical protein